MFLIVFGNIAKIPTDGVPQVLFYMNGIILWNYFSKCLLSTSNTFVSNAGIFVFNFVEKNFVDTV